MRQDDSKQNFPYFFLLGMLSTSSISSEWCSAWHLVGNSALEFSCSRRMESNREAQLLGQVRGVEEVSTHWASLTCAILTVVQAGGQGLRCAPVEAARQHREQESSSLPFLSREAASGEVRYGAKGHAVPCRVCSFDSESKLSTPIKLCCLKDGGGWRQPD